MDRDKEAELPDGIVQAIKVTTKYLQIADGVIQDVDADPTNPNSQFTCTVQVGDSQTVVFNVPLSVLIGSQGGLVVVPAVGSACEVGFRNGLKERPYLQSVDQIQDLFFTATQTTFNGGNNGGMVKVIDLVSRLNLIEQDVNNLKSAFSAWTPVPNDGGAALKVATGGWSGQQLTQTQRADVENTSIKQ